jgi:protein SCO1/2
VTRPTSQVGGRLFVQLLLLFAGVAAPLIAARGFTAFTTDTARALKVASRPRRVPDVRLLDADSVTRTFGGDGRAMIVDFIATRCQSMCAAQNGIYQQLQREIARRQLSGRIQLVTVSFDPEWDTPRALRYFAIAQRPDPSIWIVLTPPDRVVLRALLDTFGIRVIREGDEFVHNTALHVVAPNGQLVGIFPITAPDDALAMTDSVSRAFRR